jgi:KDO2-lipid IV(A) lauroyltransferase
MLPLWALFGLTQTLPVSWCLFLARRLGDLMYGALRSRARLARENLAHALQRDPEDPQLYRLARSSFRHFATVTFELLLLNRVMKRKSAHDLVQIEGQEHLHLLREQGKGAILVTAHLGNWEILGTLAPQVGYPVVSVGRHIKNRVMDAALTRLRSRFGQRIVDKDGATLPVVREIKRGGLVAMLMDIHAGRRGMRVDFFGRPASTFVTAAQLARRLKVPCVPTLSWRRGPLQILVRVGPPILPDPELDEEEDVYRMTRTFHQLLERTILEHPDQWLWFHRRWKKGGKEPKQEWITRYAGAQ